jgi:hypothetical protein
MTVFAPGTRGLARVYTFGSRANLPISPASNGNGHTNGHAQAVTWPEIAATLPREFLRMQFNGDASLAYETERLHCTVGG